MLKKYLPIVAGTLLLAGCALPSQVSDVNRIMKLNTPTTGTAFTQALFKEYQAAATHEVKVEYEWSDASIFASKGLLAADGEAVPPAATDAWGPLPADRTPILASARARLMSDFHSGARSRLPVLAAHAQVMYDCWVEEEHEGETDSACMTEFNATEPKLRPVAAAAAPKVAKTFIVYFNFDRTSITAAAARVLDEVKAAAEKVKPRHIYVSGFTDTMGGAAYNMALSERRANRVVSALADRGVTATNFDVESYGKQRLAVPTPNNTRNAMNRRVEIRFSN
jgi:outer membrane protein OmpA-like peptidoglycan-associated protein